MSRVERYPVWETWRAGWGDWYGRRTYPDGRTWHSEPWLSEWAAAWWCDYDRARYFRAMSKRGELGNGEPCPLFPEHGNMYVLTGRTGGPQVQYCGHVAHDALSDTPGSRVIWPLHGFDESVLAYKARVDRAQREAELPDLGDIPSLIEAE